MTLHPNEGLIATFCLLVDCDPQGSLSISLGVQRPDEERSTLAAAYSEALGDREPELEPLIRRHSEGLDFIPANVDLSSVEVTLVNAVECLDTHIETTSRAIARQV